MLGDSAPDQVWTRDDLPDLDGKTYLVTGPTLGGLGHDVAATLAQHGAHVVLAGRSRAKLEATAADIRQQSPNATIDQLEIDLADLASVRRAAAKSASFGAIDCLINNAGIMATPFRRTVDGFESQFATNHLGAFLLSGLLLPQLVASGEGRIVAVASQAHRLAREAPLRDPLAKRRYSRVGAYAQSKLANLLFTYELARRAAAAELPIRATAAHPGYAASHLVANGVGRAVQGAASIVAAANQAMGQSVAMGAEPILMAATADLPSGSYVGPSGPGELRGHPRIVSSSALSQRTEVQRQFWALSENAVGLRWP